MEPLTITLFSPWYLINHWWVFKCTVVVGVSPCAPRRSLLADWYVCGYVEVQQGAAIGGRNNQKLGVGTGTKPFFLSGPIQKTVHRTGTKLLFSFWTGREKMGLKKIIGPDLGPIKKLIHYVSRHLHVLGLTAWYRFKKITSKVD